MSCSHCANAVTKALTGIDGVVDVAVDLKEKTVAVKHEESVLPEMLKMRIEDLGFDVV
jgi:copper chaperone CopZ